MKLVLGLALFTALFIIALSGCTFPNQPVCGDGVCQTSQENENNCSINNGGDCPPNNQPTTCEDGTTDNKCSDNRPLFCDKSKLVNNCKTCGCFNSNYNCLADNSCKRIEISEPKYDCTYCEGFCFSKDPNRGSFCASTDKYYEWDKYPGAIWGRSCVTQSDCGPSLEYYCIDNTCIKDYMMDFSSFFGVQLKLEYPQYVKINSEFPLKITVENQNENEAKVRIYNVSIGTTQDVGQRVPFDQTKNIPSKQSETFEVKIPGINSYTFTGNIYYSIEVNDGADYLFNTLENYGKPIITSFCDAQNTKVCGKLKYCEKDATCLNNTLYPAPPQAACLSNSECSDDAMCLNYSCFLKAPIEGINPNKTNEVALFGFFVYDDDSKFNQVKSQKIQYLEEIAKISTDWFNSEREYQKAQNNLNVNYSTIPKLCRLTKNEYLNILSSCEAGPLVKCEEKQIDYCGIERNKYDIIIKVINFEDGILDDSIYSEMRRIGYPGAPGASLGKLIYLGFEETPQKGYPGIIHETLHSFGEYDIRIAQGAVNELYQERNCNLFRSMWPDFLKNPHLCDLEAKIIGWKN